jgi:hypothetical protein
MLKKSMMILVALGALMGTGCGHGGETQVDIPEDDGYQAPAPTGPAYPGQPGYGAPGQPGYPAQPGLQQGAPSLAALQQAWAQVRTLSANYDLWEKGSKGTETANVKFFYQKSGSKYRYEVSKHSASIKNGSKSVFDTRTRKIESRLGGMASFLPIKGTLDDERSKSVRNYTLDMTDYATQTELLLVPGAQVTERTPGVLELARPAKYPGVEAMRVTLDARKFPSAFELVAGGQVVYRKRITGLQVNPSLGSDKFSL